MNNTIQEEEEEEVEEKQMSTAKNLTLTPALLPTEFNSVINSLPSSPPLQNEPFLDAPPQPSIQTHRFVWKQRIPPPPQLEVQVQDDNDDEEDEDEDEDEDDNDDEDEENENEEMESLEEGDGDEVVAETTATAEELIDRKKKLADGFFEVESIRKKRVCKGEPQYLIKWRGWPESANTWEPVDHLQTCPDIVEAYEKSLQSGQKKSYRKRKRKFTQQKKKMQFYYGATKSKVSPVKLSLSNEDQDSASLDSNNHADPQPSMVDVVVKHEETIKRSVVTKKVDDNGFTSASPTIASFEKNHSKSLQLPGQNAIGIHSVVHLEKDGPRNQLLKSTCVETGQSNPRRGAQRRKSGSIRRFKQDETSLNVDCLKTPFPVNGSASKRPEQPMVGNSDASRKRKSDTSKSSVITKIIKPISYSASATNNAQDVAVTFLATRFDGKEVLVDNKFLKATNPLLLINFYEQHLRYNPA